MLRSCQWSKRLRLLHHFLSYHEKLKISRQIQLIYEKTSFFGDWIFLGVFLLGFWRSVGVMGGSHIRSLQLTEPPVCSVVLFGGKLVCIYFHALGSTRGVNTCPVWRKAKVTYGAHVFWQIKRRVFLSISLPARWFCCDAECKMQSTTSKQSTRKKPATQDLLVRILPPNSLEFLLII